VEAWRIVRLVMGMKTALKDVRGITERRRRRDYITTFWGGRIQGLEGLRFVFSYSLSFPIKEPHDFLFLLLSSYWLPRNFKLTGTRVSGSDSMEDLAYPLSCSTQLKTSSNLPRGIRLNHTRLARGLMIINSDNFELHENEKMRYGTWLLWVLVGLYNRARESINRCLVFGDLDLCKIRYCTALSTRRRLGALHCFTSQFGVVGVVGIVCS
jgi:hypothetical protein